MNLRKRVWRWICMNLSWWICVFFLMNLENKVSWFGDEIYKRFDGYNKIKKNCFNRLKRKITFLHL